MPASSRPRTRSPPCAERERTRPRSHRLVARRLARSLQRREPSLACRAPAVHWSWPEWRSNPSRRRANRSRSGQAPVQRSSGHRLAPLVAACNASSRNEPVPTTKTRTSSSATGGAAMAFAGSSLSGAENADGSLPSIATIRSNGPASVLICQSRGFRGSREIVCPDIVHESCDELARTVSFAFAGEFPTSRGETNGSIGEARRNMTGCSSCASWSCSTGMGG